MLTNTKEARSQVHKENTMSSLKLLQDRGLLEAREGSTIKSLYQDKFGVLAETPQKLSRVATTPRLPSDI